MNKRLHILFISDIIGSAGRDAVASELPKLRNKFAVDLVIANGENATMGLGIDDKTIRVLHEDLHIDVITSGNHIWQRRKYLKNIDQTYILRPLNYPEECPGHGSCIFETEGQIKVGIINLQGRSFMSPIDCPFKTVQKTVEAFMDTGKPLNHSGIRISIAFSSIFMRKLLLKKWPWPGISTVRSAL